MSAGIVLSALMTGLSSRRLLVLRDILAQSRDQDSYAPDLDFSVFRQTTGIVYAPPERRSSLLAA
jgi:hypothetical protein